MSLYLKHHQNLNKPINVEILDFSYSSWKQSNSEILSNCYQSENITFNWLYGDFKGDEGSFSSKKF